MIDSAIWRTANALRRTTGIKSVLNDVTADGTTGRWYDVTTTDDATTNGLSLWHATTGTGDRIVRKSSLRVSPLLCFGD